MLANGTMLTFLSRPYHQGQSTRSVLRRGLAFGLFVFLFLWVFRPFGLDRVPQGLLLITAGYGLVCSVTMLLLNLGGPLLLVHWFDEQRWTVGREILWSAVNVACIGAANVWYSVAMAIMPFSWGALIWFELYTLLIGLFPISAMVLINEARWSRRYRDGSQRVNASMARPIRKDPEPPVPTAPVDQQESRITIPSESGREDLELALADLLFIRSAGNYVEVHHVVKGRPARTVLRGSLKRVEAALSTAPVLFRCHKSHVVNLGRVVRVSGNAQGFKLHLGDDVEQVPVSRQFNGRLEDLLGSRS